MSPNFGPGQDSGAAAKAALTEAVGAQLQCRLGQYDAPVVGEERYLIVQTPVGAGVLWSRACACARSSVHCAVAMPTHTCIDQCIDPLLGNDSFEYESSDDGHGCNTQGAASALQGAAHWTKSRWCGPLKVKHLENNSAQKACPVVPEKK